VTAGYNNISVVTVLVTEKGAFMLTIKKYFMLAILFIGAVFAAPISTQQTTDTIQFKMVKVDPKQVACMAKNIFYEAGHESLKGQAAVARVVMNRVAYGFANNPCGVVYQKTVINNVTICQFSWVCEGKNEPNKNSKRYKDAEQVAFEVMATDKYQDVVPKSTLFFHSINIDPLWPHKQVAIIGGHVFYSKAKKQTQPKIKNNNE
jgi:spore germination cell wall hydrolase CwlJ-like protein